jgi:hypothetical protein
MSHSVEFIASHPAIAFVVMCIHLALTVVIYDLQLPTIIMQIFQLLAFASTITVGVITLCKFFKKDK